MVYVSASETGLLFVCVVYAPDNVRSDCQLVLVDQCEQLVAWAHKDDGLIPLEADRESKRTITDKFSFWKVVNNYVKQNGPFPPLKLFRDGAQSFYSKTKGGVDLQLNKDQH